MAYRSQLILQAQLILLPHLCLKAHTELVMDLVENWTGSSCNPLIWLEAKRSLAASVWRQLICRVCYVALMPPV